MPVTDHRSLALRAAREAIVDEVEDHLLWNVRAYGKAWTEERGDTEFIIGASAEKALDAAAEHLNPFEFLTADQRQLLVCALAGNHPERLAPLRMDVLRMLAKADRATSPRQRLSTEDE